MSDRKELVYFPTWTAGRKGYAERMRQVFQDYLKSRELQDRAIAEVHRVLRPGGSFFVFEIEDGWMERIAHYRSTFTPVAAGSAFARLNKAGFSKISVDFRRGGYRFRARKAMEACADENTSAFASSATA